MRKAHYGKAPVRAVVGKQVYLTKTGFKVGSKGKVQRPGDFYKSLPDKGARRKFRKAARLKGLSGQAAAPTASKAL